MSGMNCEWFCNYKSSQKIILRKYQTINELSLIYSVIYNHGDLVKDTKYFI